MDEGLRGGLPIHGMTEHRLDRRGAGQQARGGLFAGGFVREDQRLADSRQVTAQRQGAVLQHAFPFARLGRADQLPAVDRDLVGGRHFEADRVERRTSRACVFLHFHGQAEVVHGAQQRPGQAVVGFEHGARHARFVGGSGYGVGQLVGVQDGAAAGQTAHQIPAAVPQAERVHVRVGLGVPEREAGR